MVSIHALSLSDLNNVKLIQPEGWPDIIPHFEFYLSSPFCIPIKAEYEGTIVGVGAAICHGETGWLAHIIVHAEKRNLGIGKSITQSLINILENKNCSTLLLLATALGEPVYKKAGFETDLKYLFFKHEKLKTQSVVPTSCYTNNYEASVLKLDRDVTGEDRSELLKPHLSSCELVVNGSAVRGCYFKTLGEGLILANDEEAGRALLNRKHEFLAKVALPETNKAGISFLQQQGFEQFSHGMRMWRGKKLNWQSEKLYSRIGGNLG
jgi:hypothetical protein